MIITHKPQVKLMGLGKGLHSERMGDQLQKCMDDEQWWRTLSRLSWAHCWISSGVHRSEPVTTGSPDPAPSSPEASLPNCSWFEVVCDKMPNGARCEGLHLHLFPPALCELSATCSEAGRVERSGSSEQLTTVSISGVCDPQHRKAQSAEWLTLLARRLDVG